MSASPVMPSAPRAIDLASVNRVLQRMSRAGEPPWLHTEVARRMAERLTIIRLQPQTLLDWWGFTGAGADVLAHAYPGARRWVVEPTEALRRKSEDLARAPWWTPWRRTASQVVSEADLAPDSVQMVWANMMLHAAHDPAALFARWQRLLSVDGFVMFSCLGPGSLRELRDVYARLGEPSPMADLVDMHDLGDMLLQAGFADPVMDQEVLTVSWATPESLLAELRGLGANAAPDRFAGLRTSAWKSRLLGALQSLAAPDGRITMSFEVAYGHAFKVQPRATEAPTETAVSVDEMRALIRKRSGRQAN